MLALGLSIQLSSMLKQGALSIQVVSPIEKAGKISRILVGNPGDRELYSRMGISEKELVAECDGQFSWGFQYVHDANVVDSKRGWFCYGDYGFSVAGIPFQHLWKKYNSVGGNRASYEDFSLAAHCARQNRFCHPQKNSKSMLAGLDYALNIDAKKLCILLKKRAIQAGVKVHTEEIASVKRNQEQINIESLELLSGHKIAGDLFLDTNCERRLYKEVASLSSDEENCAYVFHARKEDVDNFDTGTVLMEKHDLGWLQSVTLDQRVHYIFTPVSDKIEAAKCEAFLVNHLNPGSGEIEVLPVYSNLEAPWVNNVVAMGAAACSLEGFCVSTASLVLHQLKILLELIPGVGDSNLCSLEYNRRANILFKQLDELRGLHRVLPTTKSEDIKSPVNENYNNVMHRIRLFSERGRVAFSEIKLLSDSEWAVLLIALNVIPDAYDPILEKHDFTVLRQKLDAGRALITQLVQQIATAKEYRKRLLTHTR